MHTRLLSGLLGFAVGVATATWRILWLAPALEGVRFPEAIVNLVSSHSLWGAVHLNNVLLFFPICTAGLFDGVLLGLCVRRHLILVLICWAVGFLGFPELTALLANPTLYMCGGLWLKLCIWLGDAASMPSVCIGLSLARLRLQRHSHHTRIPFRFSLATLMAAVGVISALVAVMRYSPEFGDPLAVLAVTSVLAWITVRQAGLITAIECCAER